jgi:hypothetical protein
VLPKRRYPPNTYYLRNVMHVSGKTYVIVRYTVTLTCFGFYGTVMKHCTMYANWQRRNSWVMKKSVMNMGIKLYKWLPVRIKKIGEI